jgi:hypothetical protein
MHCDIMEFSITWVVQCWTMYLVQLHKEPFKLNANSRKLRDQIIKQITSDMKAKTHN